MRDDMSEVEQGKVLIEIKQMCSEPPINLQLSNKELAKLIGRSAGWVDTRLRIAMKLDDSVVQALNEDKISMRTAETISTLEPHVQHAFLLYILGNKIKDDTEVRKAKKRFQNNTIYTIGIENRLIRNRYFSCF